MNQLQRAIEICKRFHISEDVDALREVLGEAQNGPPDGAADGSITSEQWYLLRSALNKADAAMVAINRILGVEA